jgi:hypothetical protein
MPMGTICNCLYASVKNILNPFIATSFIRNEDDITLVKIIYLHTNENEHI